MIFRIADTTTGRYLDIALWSGKYVIYNPVVSFDLRCTICQSGIYQHMELISKYLKYTIVFYSSHFNQFSEIVWSKPLVILQPYVQRSIGSTD